MDLNEYLENCYEQASDAIREDLVWVARAEPSDRRRLLGLVEDQVATMVLVEDHRCGTLEEGKLRAFLEKQLAFEKECAADTHDEEMQAYYQMVIAGLERTILLIKVVQVLEAD